MLTPRAVWLAIEDLRLLLLFSHFGLKAFVVASSLVYSMQRCLNITSAESYMTKEFDEFSNEEFIEITEQGPDKDFEGMEQQAPSTAWSAEWWGPEEKTEDPELLKTYGMHISYNEGEEHTWWYPEIRVAVETQTVKEFAYSKGFRELPKNDLDELEAFLFHYVRFMTFDVEVPNQDETAPAVWEPEGITEKLGDNDLEVFQKEYKETGGDLNIDDVKRHTLH
jgi:hypothetical protein